MVTVVGLGFVGLTTALGLAEYGHKVYGIEINSERFSCIADGKLPFFEPGLDEALTKHLGKNFIPTANWKEAIADSEYVFYCVGTPYGENGQADLTYLFKAIEQTIQAINDTKFRVLITKSTVPPSTTQERIIPFVKGLGIEVPKQIGIANNPEFLREGHCWDDFINADRIVFGTNDEKSEKMLKKLYEKSGRPICSVNLNTAEFIKYLSNTSLACLISFANEMSQAADAIGGIDIAQAFLILHTDARWQTGSIRNYFYPGCGYGGYCLPKDTNAFYAISKSAGFDGKILQNIIATNDNMPKVAAERIKKAASDDKCRKIGILGLSFNAGSNDVRDTPAAKIIANLLQDGYRDIIAYDPIATDEFKKCYNLDVEYATSRKNIEKTADILVIVTAWPEFKELKSETGKPIVDCRYML